MILLTGGAGFIGSNLHAALAARGLETVLVDRLRDQGKWRNLARHAPASLIAPEALDDFL
ncbi:MAG: NAD-dependent epimerase/dehydratase family protein, partial [Rhodospirillales bacterium]|nr:NAD-dependent epimerase/dehydratase family protein [Rhodospirillales bacterium]